MACFFVDVAGVRDQILSHDSIVGTFIADISLQRVIEWVRTIPAVDDVRVYPGLNRVLHVHVTQRKPLARLHTGPEEADVLLGPPRTCTAIVSLLHRTRAHHPCEECGDVRRRI